MPRSCFQKTYIKTLLQSLCKTKQFFIGLSAFKGYKCVIERKFDLRVEKSGKKYVCKTALIVSYRP